MMRRVSVRHIGRGEIVKTTHLKRATVVVLKNNNNVIHSQHNSTEYAGLYFVYLITVTFKNATCKMLRVCDAAVTTTILESYFESTGCLRKCVSTSAILVGARVKNGDGKLLRVSDSYDCCSTVRLRKTVL